MQHVSAQLGGSALLCSVGSFDDRIAPGGSVRGKKLPGMSANVEVFQGDLKAVLEPFSLPSDCTLALTEFSIE